MSSRIRTNRKTLGADCNMGEQTALDSVEVRMGRSRTDTDNAMEISSFTLVAGNAMTELSQRVLNKQLTRVIVINMICLIILSALCAIAAFGSLSLLFGYWNDHRAASMITMMIAVVSIPSVIEFIASRRGYWQS